MSSDNKPNATLGIDKKRKEEASQEYKKPKKKLKQLSLITSKAPIEILSTQPKELFHNPPVIFKDKWSVTGDQTIGRVISMLEHLTARQDHVVECTDRLIALCLQEAQEDSSEEVKEDIPFKKR